MGTVGLSAIGRRRGSDPVSGTIGFSGGCSFSRSDGPSPDGRQRGDGLARAAQGPCRPTLIGLARNAASDVLTKGDKDSSQPWENPETGARGSVTPLAAAYSSMTDAPAAIFWQATSTAAAKAGCKRCLQGGHGQWEIHTLKALETGLEHDPESGHRFSEKIMLKQKAKG